MDGTRFYGAIGIYGPDWEVRKFEIGYWMRTSKTGKGYVTEAASLLCRLCSETFDARRVSIMGDVDNPKSAAVAQRLGMALEGTLRKYKLGVDGGPRDAFVYSMTDDEWSNKAIT